MKSKPHKILGIDPGYGRMGFGVILVDGSKIELVDYGVITTPASDTFEKRLLAISNDLQEVLTRNKPDAFAIEKLFFGKSSTTAMKVAESRGVALLSGAKANIPIVEYAPSQIKLALTGDGKANKQGVQKMVKELLSLPRIPKPDDAADALAVAITASNKKW
jgi:crossover junction endodeoxyribonuclease RuvC